MVPSKGALRWLNGDDLPSETASILTEVLSLRIFSKNLEIIDTRGGWIASVALPLLGQSLKKVVIYRELPMMWICDLVRECVNLEEAAFGSVRGDSSSTLPLNNHNLRCLSISCSTTHWHLVEPQLVAPVSLCKLKAILGWLLAAAGSTAW